MLYSSREEITAPGFGIRVVVKGHGWNGFFFPMKTFTIALSILETLLEFFSLRLHCQSFFADAVILLLQEKLLAPSPSYQSVKN